MVKYSWQKILRDILPQKNIMAANTDDTNLEMLSSIFAIRIDILQEVSRSIHRHYTTFEISKKNGGTRNIYAPNPTLKKVQYEIFHYLQNFAIHPTATAFIPGGSIIVNARQHLNQELFLTVDIKDFFTNTSTKRVRNFFRDQGWEKQSLDMLVSLCTYQGGLPQGAPSSPQLSNVINMELDEEIYQAASASSATYTRYGDDITFSWSTSCMDSGLKNKVTQILTNFGYEISPQKGWQLFCAEQQPEIVGVVMGSDGKLRVPQRIHEKLDKLHQKNNPDLQGQIRGYENYIKGVESASVSIA
ncbi:reverse transcriptase domain-containing protein [Candidatus Uabimicrobium amorphum]|uniref:RNA-directed DNA polymerase n=1 Tax=Uabimicrobium amorphum TaxID=2596890 RepID=A0A5S9F473_UABAM|nr:reverse transcriptase domain-containing protein [Candidatus Uabimicrobium amorphum]BBM85507.1 RNA-directed DNA polymerase [Candidatus Uabimicrobium amorphum]